MISAGPDRVGAAFHARMVKLKQEGGTPLSAGAELCGYLASAESDGHDRTADLGALGSLADFAAEQRQEIAGSDIYTLRRIVPTRPR